MFMKWGENGKESCVQSQPGGEVGWYPVILAKKNNFNPVTQTVRYEFIDGVIYERIEGNPALLYNQARRREYPDIRDQLDAIWKGGDALEEMRRKVMEVKEKYPKQVAGDSNAQG
jgi:hypothetical protein